MTLAVFNRTIVDSSGDILPGAIITVTDNITGNVSSLFSDAAGLVAIANPITLGSTAFLQFYVRSGRYNINAVGNGNTVNWVVDLLFGSPSPFEGEEFTATEQQSVFPHTLTDISYTMVTVAGVRLFSNEYSITVDDLTLVTPQSAGIKVILESTIDLGYDELARQWANSDEDDLVSGGEYSSKHWSAKSSQWATEVEDTAIDIAAGGDGSTTFSSLHWASKSSTSATNSEVSNVSSAAQAVLSQAAAESSGGATFYDTKSDANTALGGHSEDDIVEVLIDESLSNRRTRYRVESSTYVFKVYLSPVKATYSEFEAQTPLANFLDVETLSTLLKVSTSSNTLSLGLGSDYGAGTTTVVIGGNSGGSASVANSVGVGYQALSGNSGNNASCLGSNAGANNSDSYLCAIGYLAGTGNTSGQNISIGGRSGQDMTGGGAVYVGYNAGNTSLGANTVAIGNEAGRNQIGAQNTYVGGLSGWYSWGTTTVALGYNTFSQAASDNSVYIGNTAGQYTAGNYVVAIGSAVAPYSSGDYNTYLGFGAGGTPTAAASTTAITAFTSTTFTCTGHGFATGKKVLVTMGGTTAPTGYTLAQRYWFTATDGNTLTIAGTLSAAPTDIGTSATIDLFEGFNFTNCSMVGYNSEATKNNQVMLGNTSVLEVKSNGCFTPGTRTRGSLPSAATYVGGMFYCTDITGGGRVTGIVYSDGTNWRDIITDTIQS